MLAERVRRESQRHSQSQKPTPQIEGKSYAGYTGLKGKIVTVNVTKVTRKLGIAVDGGSNTKQKAVIIRQITVSNFPQHWSHCLVRILHFSLSRMAVQA